MTLTIHPKAGGAALGGTLGVLITAILTSIHGVHLAPELPGAISAFCAALGAFLIPSGEKPALKTLEPIAGLLHGAPATPVIVNVNPAGPAPVVSQQAPAPPAA